MVSDKIVEIDENVENIAEAIRENYISEPNMFDGTYDKAYVGGGSQDEYTLSDNTRTAIIKCKPNTTYTIRKVDSSNRFSISTYNSRVETFTRLNLIVANSSLISYTFTTDTDAKYIYVYVSNQNEEPRLMVNEGSIELPYKKYDSRQYKLREMASAITDMADDIKENMKTYIPKATTEEKQFKAIPLSISQKMNGNVEQNGESTPDNPQEVKTMKCVNRLDVEDIELIEKGYIVRNKPIELDIGTYTISYKTNLTTGATSPMFKNKQGQIIVDKTIYNNSEKSLTFTLTEKAYFLDFYSNTAGKFYDFMLTEGTLKPYTPYGYIREDFVGKNIADPNKLYEEMKAYNSGTTKEVVDGRNCIKFYNHWFNGKPIFSKIYKENTQYTLNLKARVYDTSIVGVNALYVCFYYNDGTRSLVFSNAQGSEWINFKLTSDPNKTISYIMITYGNIETWLIDLDTFIICEGTDDTYEPYKSTYQLIYIGDNELLTDDFVEVDEKGNTKIKKGWGKVVLTGDEEFVDISTNATRTWYAINFANYNIYEYNNPIAICDVITSKFKARMQSGAFLPNQVAMMTNTKNIFFIFEPNTTEEQARTILRDMPIYFKLAEPTETDLGKHEKIVPLEGTNNIEVQATLEPSKITTTHYYDYRGE